MTAMTETASLVVSTSTFPYGATALALFTGLATLEFDDTKNPYLSVNGSTVEEEENIIYALAREAGLSDDSVKTERFISIARSLSSTSSFDETLTILNELDNHLAYRTFLVGHDTTVADWMLWGNLKGSLRAIGVLKLGQHPHLHRWFSHIENLPTTQTALSLLVDAKVSKARGSSKTASSFALGLPGAEMGRVVTRFPPEPSGYLHIGHAKAATLNQYFAKMYTGKLIIRFDDTNPTKERTEFEETILEDLGLLGVNGDVVSHTSDYFDKLYRLALEMVKAGKAYADDTDGIRPVDIPCNCNPKQHGKLTAMAHLRWHGIASKHRDASVEENLRRFEQMKMGSEEGLRWCLRAKLSVDDPNKALRDPVIYRTNHTAHHRTGDKWKIYPTYDFACPVVDSLEGVTHALRTNEYRDRNPQYSWMIQALDLRPVHIWDFSRLNFIYTLLSKRKLHWFVDKGLVSGWDDPRFPTVRGIRRRGMTVEAIQQFMLSQGPSQAVVSLEWDSIWALNKKIIDPVAPRFWALSKPHLVQVSITGIGTPLEHEIRRQPKHKKDAAVGEKDVIYASTILVEQRDATSFDDQEEITLMSWGNAIVKSKSTSATGGVTSLEMTLNLAGDFQKTKKKVTWLAVPTNKHPLVDVVLLDFDYLITKKKLEDGDKMEDFVTPVTEFREDALTDANVLGLKKGDIIQFERKGYFIFDGIGKDKKREFIRIPDGKASNLAKKAM